SPTARADAACGPASGVLAPPSPHVGWTTLGSVVAAVAALGCRLRRPQPRCPFRRGRGCGRRARLALASAAVGPLRERGGSHPAFPSPSWTGAGILGPCDSRPPPRE